MPLPSPLSRQTLLALLDPARTPRDGALWVGPLLGAVHRLAWLGPDEAGHRERCLDLLRGMVASCAVGDEHDQRLATLVDWWLHVSQGEAVVGRAFHVEAVLPDPGLAEPLTRLAQAGPTALEARRRPIVFQRAIAALEARLQAIPAIKKSPGPEIYGEARDEAMLLLNLARDGRPRSELPSLRLLGDDLEDWASETRGTQALDRHLKVWNSLLKHLETMKALAVRVHDQWTPDPVQPSGLPVDWAERIRALGGPHADLLPALLVDLASLDGEVPPDLRAPLEPAWTLAVLGAVDKDLDEALRVRLLAVVEEARALTTHAAPPWVEATLARLDDLRIQIRTLRSEAQAIGAAEAAGNLDEALGSLQRFELGDSEQWIQFAEDELQARRQDAEAARLGQQVAQRTAALEELGLTDLAARAEESPERHLERLERLYEDQRARLQAAVAEVRGQHQPVPLRTSIEGLLDQVGRRLERGALSAAARALHEANELLATYRLAEEERLLPAARELRARAEAVELHDGERRDLMALAERISLCAAEGLPVSELLDAGLAFIDAAERGVLDELPVLALAGDLPPLQRQRRVRLLAWVGAGVRVSPLRLPSTELYLSAEHSKDLEASSIRVLRCRSGWVGDDGRTLALSGPPQVPPRGHWHDVLPVSSVHPVTEDEIRAYGGSHDLSDTVFLSAGDHVLGPYEPDDEAVPHPADGRGFVGRLDREAFDALFGRLDVELGDDRTRSLVHVAPDLDTLLQQDADPVDQLEPSHVEVWLAGLAEDLDRDTVGRLARVVAALEVGGGAVPRPLLDARLEALRGALRSARRFERVRTAAVDDFLRTPEAGAMLEARARQAIERRVASLSGEVERRRAELEHELAGVQGQIEGARAELAQVAAEVEAEREALADRVASLREEVEELAALREDRRARLLVELLGARATATGGQADPPVARRPVALPLDEAVTPPLRELVSELQQALPAWAHEDVANLLLTLLTSRWTLLAGPPGVGKSTFARGLLAGLGHGPGTHRYLELVVRHEWQDDAPLFGFWHPERGAWVPSSEGFVEHLLRASHDAQEGFGGLYTCVLEELNLAAPEYYLARPISAFEAREPVIRLYGEDVRPTNGHAYPGTVAVGENVRLVGTVNVDDTVQRLSPRFLSRAGVIWMEPSPETLYEPAPPLPVGARPVAWDRLLAQVPAGSVEVPPSIRKVVELLHQRRVPGAPSPRTIRGIEGYLAASEGLLPLPVAADLQVCQRILPSIRGVGSDFRGRLDDLVSLLRAQQMPRSAARAQRLRERGEALGDYYDMFHV